MKGVPHHTDIPFIRHWLALGYTQRSIGASFGVHSSIVSDIKTGRLWAEVR
jgi:hypothetical protein